MLYSVGSNCEFLSVQIENSVCSDLEVGGFTFGCLSAQMLNSVGSDLKVGGFTF